MDSGHRHEHGRVTRDGGDDTADACLDLPVPVHVGVVEHDVAPAADPACRVGLALAEDGDHTSAQVLGPGPLRQLEARVADGLPHPVSIEGVLHDAVADLEPAAPPTDV